MKFVWLDVPGGGQIPVNPDLVAYLREGSEADEGRTQLVFGAANGGLHTVTVAGERREVARKLEGFPEHVSEAMFSAIRGCAAPGDAGRGLAPRPSSPKAKRPTPKAARPQRT